MSGVRNLLWLVPLLLLAAAPLWWRPVTDFLAPRGGVSTTARAGAHRAKRFVMAGVHFTQHRNGEEEWRIDSRQLQSRDSNKELTLDGVDATLLDRGASRFHITSERGHYDQQKHVLVLQEKVVVRDHRGYTLYSSLLRYSESPEKLTTTAPVRLVGPDMVVTGTGLDYDMASGVYRVGGRVRMQTL